METKTRRVFCPKCGEMELLAKEKHFQSKHPELSKVMATFLDDISKIKQ